MNHFEDININNFQINYENETTIIENNSPAGYCCSAIITNTNKFSSEI